MKSLVATLVVASSVVLPSFSFAQLAPGPTRAEVRDQMACARQQGMIPQPKEKYPFAEKRSGMPCDTSGSGAAMTGGSQAGAPMPQRPNQMRILFGHH
ncbi:DUF4148 domain-containing protein [Burkholderia multivorans]